MIKQNLLECNQLERSKDEVTARTGLIMFDGFIKAMNIEEIIKKHMPVPGSNRGLKSCLAILKENRLNADFHNRMG